MLKLDPSYEDVKFYLAQLDWAHMPTNGIWFCRETGFFLARGQTCDGCPFHSGEFLYPCKFTFANPHLPHLLTQIRHLHPEYFI